MSIKGLMTVKKILFAFFAIILTVAISSTGEAAKKRVAIMDCRNSTGINIGSVVAQQMRVELEAALIQSGAYEVVERDRLNYVLGELGLHQTGIIDGGSAIEMGEMAGADYSVFIDIVSSDVVSQDNILYKAQKGKVRINFKFVDNKTGATKLSENVEGTKTVSEYEAKHVNSTSLLHDATVDCARKIRDLIMKTAPMTGSVIGIQGKQVYINMGMESGVREKDVFLVYKEGKPLFNPATQTIIGVQEEKVGYITITDVQAEYSIGNFKADGDVPLTQDCKVKKRGGKK